jgi:hypothetical protein
MFNSHSRGQSEGRQVMATERIPGVFAPRLAWARAEIVEVRCEMAARFPDPEHRLRKRAEAILDRAEETSDVDAKWLFVYRAREILIWAMDRDEIDAAVCSLRALATRPGDVMGGRLDAVLALLDELDHALADHEDSRARKLLAEATRLRYDGYSNDYRRLTITRHHQAVLLFSGVPILFAVVWLLAYATDHSQNLDGNWARGGQACVACVAVGTLGALTSAAQRSTQVKGHRVHEQLASSVNSLSRVPLGAVAGLTVWLFSLATSDGQLNAPNMLLIAFGAGFAERLVVQTAGVVDTVASQQTLITPDTPTGGRRNPDGSTEQSRLLATMNGIRKGPMKSIVPRQKAAARPAWPRFLKDDRTDRSARRRDTAK